jgi:hypothetical protein
MLNDNIRLAVEMIGFLGGGMVLLYRIGRITEKFTQIGRQQSLEISGLKEETSQLKRGIARINDLLIALTKLDGRIDRIEDRQLAQGKRLDEVTMQFNRTQNHARP